MTRLLDDRYGSMVQPLQQLPVRRGRRGRLHVGFVTGLGGGGAERVTLTLAETLIQRGHHVDLLLLRPFGSYRAAIPRRAHVYYLPAMRRGSKDLLRWCRERNIRLRRLRVGPSALLRTWSALRRNHPKTPFRFKDILKEVFFAAGVSHYVRGRRPTLLYGTAFWPNIVTVAGAKLASPAVPAVISVHSVVSLGYTETQVAAARARYPQAEAVVAVSHGVGADTSRVLGVPEARVHPLFNPIPVAAVRRLSRQQVSHPWFGDAEVPVLLTVGRPVPVKDHATLVKAFGSARRQRPVRLVIMGSSSQSYRAHLRAAAAAFEAEQDLDFLDFDENPYRYMHRAAALVLSSRYEACPTVLIEAMACGTAVVSTDAPYGPAELLGGGRWGKLTPVGDADALARAILDTLNGDTIPKEELRRRADAFAADRVTAAYEMLFEQVASRQR